MEHSLQITHDFNLKGCEIIVQQLTGFTEGSAIRIQQNNRVIYTIYRPSNNHNSQSNTIKVGKRIMLQNGFEKGTCKVSIVLPSPKKSKDIKVVVSQLDWQIVSSRANMLQSQFLNQINLIWPNGKIPLYYTFNDCVILNCQCDDIFIVDSEAQIQIKVKDGQNMKKQEELPVQQEVQIPSKQVIRFQGKNWDEIVKKNAQGFQFGYQNCIQISRQLYELMKFQKNQYYILETSLPIPLTCFSSIQQYQSHLKTIQAKQKSDKKQKNWTRKLEESVVVIVPSQKLVSNNFTCSDYCRRLFNLEDLMVINKEKISNFKVITLTMFLKDKENKIVLNPIMKGQINIQQIKEIFCKNFIIQLRSIYQQSKQQQNTSFVFLQQGIPIRISRECLAFGKIVTKDKYGKIQQAAGSKQLVKLVHTSSSLSSGQQKQKLIKQLQNHIQVQVPSVQGYSQQVIRLYNDLISNSRQFASYQLIQKRPRSQQIITECYLHIYKNQIEELQKHLKANDYNESISKRKQAYFEKFILLTSFAKNGKSLMHKILSIKQHHSWYINFQSLNNNTLHIEQINSYIQSIFQWCPYQIIFIDNIDSLCYNVDEGDIHRQRQRIISKFILNKLKKFVNVYGKQVIMTAASKDSIDQSFGSFVHIALKNPERQHRVQFFKKYRQTQMEEEDSQSLQYKKRIQQESVSFTTLMKSILKQKDSFNSQIQSIKKKQRIPMNFQRLAGLKQAKDYIKRTIEKPIKYSELYKKLPIKMPRGVLLYGASGTGKSALGNALKDQFSMKFFSVKGSDILSKYIGGSEAAVRQVFEKALSVAPSIIFFDQFQSIVPRRNSSNTGVTDRVVNQFLCYLDGVSSITGVFIVAASSRPDLIDPALLRPGRLDIHLHLDFPNEQERLELLKMFSKTSISIELTDEQFLEATKGYNYSDLIGLMKELRIKKASIALKQQNPTQKQFKQISKQFFNEIYANFKVSTSQSERNRQKTMYENFKNKKAPDIKQQKAVLY